MISPLLANIFLHYVLDEWFEKEVRPRLKGEAFVIRYADDFVIGVAREDDARRIMDVLPKRMSKYGLTVHPEKTRLVRFEPPQAADSETEEREPTRTDDIRLSGIYPLLGTIPARRMGGQTEDGEEPTQACACTRCRNGAGRTCTIPIKEQHQKLTQKLRGHYGYYGIIGNFSSLQEFLEEARRIWRRKLSRRRRDGDMTWAEFLRLEKRYSLPRARVVHGLLSGVAKS